MGFRAVQISSFILLAFIFSCRSETDEPALAAPGLSIEEVGVKNSKIAYPGQDLHIQAAIVAAGKIAEVKLQVTLAGTNYGWDYIQSYPRYNNLINAGFHEHIDIPADAKPGIYTLLLIVKDQLGQKVQGKVDFEIVKDPALPLISNVSYKLVTPDLIEIQSDFYALNKVERSEVEVQSSVWTKNYVFRDSLMAGTTVFRFNERLDISGSPAGHYHINIKLVDGAGKNAVYQIHWDKNN